MKFTKLNILIIVMFLFVCCAEAQNDTLKVGLAGSAPFVMQEENMFDGISVEIWKSLSAASGILYNFQKEKDVSVALDKLTKGKLDIVVGPVSITSERAKAVHFTQPYFLSSLVIASRVEESGIWGHIKPFFSKAFFIAIGVFLLILAVVGALVWLAERKVSPDQFPMKPLRGIFNGIWFALVTMTTVGYGDKAPKTAAGKVVTMIWMVIALITATSIIAGISSTLTVSRLSSSAIESAQEMAGKRIAVVDDSPAEQFVEEYSGKVVSVKSLQQAFKNLKDGSAAAVVYDKPQILYFLKENPEIQAVVSSAEYMPQGYGFALRKDSEIADLINVSLLHLKEAGEVNEIVENRLGK